MARRRTVPEHQFDRLEPHRRARLPYGGGDTPIRAELASRALSAVNASRYGRYLVRAPHAGGYNQRL